MLDFDKLDAAEDSRRRAMPAGEAAEEAPTAAGATGARQLLFRLLTWNTLAPVYFREDRGYGVEADQPGAFLTRNTKICAAIAEAAADIVCLQEHWFEPMFTKLYKERLGELGYRYEALRRTAWNCDGRTEDGVAVLVRERTFKVLERHDIWFQDYGIPQDRVALLLTLSNACVGREVPELAVLCTHLTYPHSRYDVESRNAQICACLRAAERQLPQGTPLVVAGDLNGPSSDSVSALLRRAGFQNAWDVFHGRPCRVTHTDHRRNNFASDHVWLRGPLAARGAALLPDGTPDNTPLQRPTIGAVASGSAPPGTFAEWCELSDHRPLVVALSWDT